MQAPFSVGNMDAPEARRGDFVYRDALFVDVGSGRRHARASPTELKSLLLPKTGSAVKDQVAHFYEAQLVHYGLPRSREKNTAKVRLTNAINSKSLVVPKEITQLESELKKEYASMQRKAKTKTKPTATARKEIATKIDKGSSSSKTTIELEVDGVKLKIGREALQPAKTNAAKSKAAKTGGTAPKIATPSKSPGPKKITGAINSSGIARPSPAKSVTSATAARPKQTTRNTVPSPSLKQSYSGDEDLSMGEAPPSYESHDFSHHHSSPPPKTVQISGTYFTPRPPIRPFQLALQVDRPTQNLWGCFEIGSKTGILFADIISGAGNVRDVSFRWRSTDQETGAADFRRDCEGSMTFDGEDWVQGIFRKLVDGEDVAFEAERVNDEGIDLDDVQREWDAIPRRAYGRR
jgi:hypothetical protein